METPAAATAPPPPGLAPKPWGPRAVLVALAFPVLVWGFSLTLSLTMDMEEDPSQAEIVGALLFTMSLQVVLIVLAVGLSLGRYRLGWNALGLGPFPRDIWWWAPVAAVGAHAALVAYSAVLVVLGAEAAAPEQENLDQLFESRAVLPLAGAVTVLMAPIAEEIFFRGFIFAGLLRLFRPGGAMVASGLLFGAFHVSDLGTMGLVLPFGLVGVLLAWIYYRTGSLWPSIATHLLFNLVSFALWAAYAGGGSG